jgi:AcrR family transcriptional regulator
MNLDSINNKNQSIKNLRVKSLFLQAAKEIIINEGVAKVTVRKIAGITGYSYATIYHYFSDLNALLLEVKAVMIKDLIEYMKLHQADPMEEVKAIKKENRIFIDYFIDQPNIFVFFYSYKLDYSNSDFEIKTDLSENYGEVYQHLVTKGIIKQEDIQIIVKTIIYSLYGALALYFSNNGLTKEKIYTDIDLIIENLVS